jgi:hypothetical protein
VVVLVGLAVVAAACSKPSKHAAKLKTNTSVAQGGEGTTASTATGGSTVPGGGAANGGTTGNGIVVGNTPSGGQGGAGQSIGAINEADIAQAQKIGAEIGGPQSTQRRQPYHAGVGDTTIQVDYGYDKTTCGVNPNAAIVAAGGLLPTPSRYFRGASSTPDQVAKDKEQAVATDVRFFNDHAFDLAALAPNVRKYMGNDPANQFYGRHMVVKMIDAGSFECPDKTTAAAKQAAETDHAFAVLSDDSLEGSAYNLAAALNTEPASIRPMSFGQLWPSDSIMSQFAPYAWTQFATGSTIVRQQAEYICSRLRGKKAVNSTDPKLSGSTRVFGLVHSNLPNVVKLANELKADLKNACGGQNIIAKEVTYNGTDIAAAQQDAANDILQLKLNVPEVTSVIQLTDVLFPVFETVQAAAQSFYPEWIDSSFGLQDASQVQRIYDSGDCGANAKPHCETRGSMGVSELGVYGGFFYDAGDSFNSWHLYHQVDPATGWHCDPSSDNGMSNGGKEDAFCKAPSVQATIYYVFLPFIGGLIFSGPDLTPQNVTNGLQAYPLTRYGGHGPSSDPRPALVQASKDHYGFIADAVEWKWHPEWTSPPPDNKPGFVEYPDCERHYIDWPAGLAYQWEANGPNYSKFCGLVNPTSPAWAKGSNDYPPFTDQPAP